MTKNNFSVSSIKYIKEMFHKLLKRRCFKIDIGATVLNSPINGVGGRTLTELMVNSGIQINKSDSLTQQQIGVITSYLDNNIDRIFAQVRKIIRDPVGSFAQMRQDILTYEGLRTYKDTALTTQDRLKSIEGMISDASNWIANYILRVYELHITDKAA